jgi:hypothetical protein
VRLPTFVAVLDDASGKFFLRWPLFVRFQKHERHGLWVAIAGRLCGGAAFFAQAFVGGSAVHFCNGAMARSFMTAQEADAVYHASHRDPDAVTQLKMCSS